MPIFGEAEYLIGGDTSKLEQAVSRAEELLNASGESFGSAFDQALDQVAAATRKAFEEVNKLGEALLLPAAGQSLASIQQAVEGIGSRTRSLATDFQKLQEAMQAGSFGKGLEIPSGDPVGGLVRSGAELDDAMESVARTIAQVEEEIRQLEATASRSERLQFVSPAFAQNAQTARLAALELRQALHDVGVQGALTKEQLEDLSRPLEQLETAKLEVPEGQLFNADEFIAESDKIVDGTKKIGGAAQKAGQDVEQMSLSFMTLDQARAQGEKVVQVLLAVGQAQGKTAQAISAQLSAQIKKVDADFKMLTETAKRFASQGQIVPTAVRQALVQTEKDARKLGLTLGQVPTKARGVSAFTQRLATGFDNLARSIEKTTGFSEREISVLLGAGLATGLAGVFRITQQATEALVKFFTEQTRLARQTRLAFGEANSEIQRFASTTATALGASETEALQTANAFAILAAESKIVGDRAVEFSKAMTAATIAIENSFPGFTNTAEAQQAVASAVGGSTEALARFGITLTELNAIAERNFGGKMFQQLSEMDQEFVRSVAIVEAARSGIERFGTSTQTITDRIRDAQKVVGDFFGAINRMQLLDDPFQNAKQSLEELIQDGEQAGGRLGAALENFKFGGQLPAIFGFFTGDPLDQFKKSVQGLTKEQLEGQRRVAEANITDKKLREEILGVIDDQLVALREHQALLEGHKTELEKQADAHEENLKRFRENLDFVRQARDAFRTLDRARRDGARAVAEAELRLQRVIEDNGRKQEDLTIKNTRAREDAARKIQDAELELIETIRDRNAAVEDAEDRLFDERLKRDRSIRDINERIEDLETDHARKLEDIQRKKAKAVADASRDIIESLIDVQLAQLAGDTLAFNAAQRQLAESQKAGDATDDLTDIERDLAREQEDHAKELKRLNRDLNEAKEDGAREVARAIRDLQREEIDRIHEIFKAELDVADARRDSVRQVQDAVRSTAQLRVEQERALRDARRGVADARRAELRAVRDATRAVRRLAEQWSLTMQTIREELDRIRFDKFNLQFFGLDENGQFANNYHGGSFAPFQPFIANESTPGGKGELIVTKSGGVVISNKEFRQFLKLLESRAVGGSQQIVVNEVANDPRATAYAVSARLGRELN